MILQMVNITIAAGERKNLAAEQIRFLLDKFCIEGQPPAVAQAIIRNLVDLFPPSETFLYWDGGSTMRMSAGPEMWIDFDVTPSAYSHLTH